MHLRIDDIAKAWSGHTVLDGVSFDAGENEFVCLLGPSGCGKTTLLRIVAGLTAPDAGRVILGGRDITPLPARERRMGLVFQAYSLFPDMTAAANVGYPMRLRRDPSAKIAARCSELLERVGLGGLGSRFPDELSGGQQQRVALARALATEPAMLLLDEPLSALDPAIRGQLRSEIDAAESMGASPWRQFVDVTVPRLRFALLAAAFLVFTESLTDFGSAVVVGGSYRVLAMEIYSEVVGQLDFAMGATLGVVLLAPALLSVWLGRLARRRQDSGDASPGRTLEPARHPGRDVALGALSVIALVPLVAVVATVAYVSVVKLWPYDRTLTLANYTGGMPDGYGPVATSLGMSLLAAVVGVVLVFALAAGLRRVPAVVAPPIQFLASLPAAVPGMVLGLGYVLAFNHGVLSGWLYGSVAIVAACSLFHYHAQAFLTMQTGMRQVPEALDDAVAVSGGGMRHVLRDAVLPFAAPAAISTFFYLFMRSLVTLSGVIFLVTPDLGLASVTVMRLDENGFLAQAAAYAMCVVLAGALALGAMRLLLHVLKDRRHVA